MDITKLDRTLIKLLSSGKFLDVNKSYNQEQHNAFVEGSLFAFDLFQHTIRENKRGTTNEGDKRNETQLAKTELQSGSSKPN